MDKQSFINSVKDGAIKGMNEYGVLASLTIAQAILESGWGRSAPGNNLFGIKWASGYASQTLSTKEFENGRWITINAQFRAYKSWNDSVEDHALFLKKNRRYANLLGLTDYKTVCRLIQQDGYATDPNYANTLISLIEQNQLYKYDEVKEGWRLESGIWHYYQKGVMIKHGWAQDSHKKWFWLDDNGNMLINGWVLWKDKWYFFGGDGAMFESKWAHWKDKQYYLGADGAMLVNCKTPDGYTVNNKGEWDGSPKKEGI